MNDSPKHRIALQTDTGTYLRQSLIRGMVSVINAHRDYELLWQDGMPFSSWDFIRKEQPDGVLCTLLNQEDYTNAVGFGGSVVNVAELMGVTDIPAVYSDNAACGAIAGSHLRSTGLRHFGYIGIQNSGTSRKRLEGFQSELPEGASLAVLEYPPHPDDLNVWSRTVRIAADWIDRLPKPVGLYVYSDVHARAVMEAVRSLGLHIPRDAAVVGTGNYDLDTNISNPTLSSVPVNWRKVACVATENLISVIEGGSMPMRTLVPPRPIFIRGSSHHFYSADRGVSKALHYIQEHFLEDLRVDDIARVAGLSRRVLEKRFRESTDTSVYAFINATRLRKAKILLIDTTETIETIAQMAGFHEGRLLVSAMKKESNTTPAEYRKKCSIYQ